MIIMIESDQSRCDGKDYSDVVEISVNVKNVVENIKPEVKIISPIHNSDVSGEVYCRGRTCIRVPRYPHTHHGSGRSLGAISHHGVRPGNYLRGAGQRDPMDPRTRRLAGRCCNWVRVQMLRGNQLPDGVRNRHHFPSVAGTIFYVMATVMKFQGLR